MTWRGPRKSGKDPLLAKAAHYKRNRAHFIRLRLPCAVCHRPIDYDGPRYINGKQNPRALVVGHIVARYWAKQMGWTDAQTTHCRTCSPNASHALTEQARSWAAWCSGLSSG
jgi:hypothetical protein